jgi:hypothetical protein
MTVTTPVVAPITSAMMTNALDTSHDGCTADHCIHQEASDSLIAEIRKRMFGITMSAAAEGLEPVMVVFFYALHVGYRLAQLQAAAPVAIEVVN